MKSFFPVFLLSSLLAGCPGSSGTDAGSDTPSVADAPSAVDAPSIGQLFGERAEELAKEKNVKRPTAKEKRHRQGQIGVDPAELSKDDKLRHHQHNVGYHQGGHDNAKPEVTARKSDARKAIATEGSGQQNRDLVCHGDQQGIQNKAVERFVDQGFDIVLPAEFTRNPLWRKDEDLLLRFDGADDQPKKGQHHDNRATNEQQPDQQAPKWLRGGRLNGGPFTCLEVDRSLFCCTHFTSS